jgi:hypothetical protein
MTKVIYGVLVTTNLYLLLTFASEIQRRVDFMYTDERNILDVNGRSLIHALAPLFTIHRELKSKSVWQRGDVDYLSTACG